MLTSTPIATHPGDLYPPFQAIWTAEACQAGRPLHNMHTKVFRDLGEEFIKLENQSLRHVGEPTRQRNNVSITAIANRTRRTMASWVIQRDNRSL